MLDGANPKNVHFVSCRTFMCCMRWLLRLQGARNEVLAKCFAAGDMATAPQVTPACVLQCLGLLPNPSMTGIVYT